jgi:hypothetical protein
LGSAPNLPNPQLTEGTGLVPHCLVDMAVVAYKSVTDYWVDAISRTVREIAFRKLNNVKHALWTHDTAAHSPNWNGTVRIDITLWRKNTY